ncbi:MAG: hypothetical protein CMF74_17260 [Maricaulis sp.]|nr:hypothetical protein [Maricaulis sp.]
MLVAILAAAAALSEPAIIDAHYTVTVEADGTAPATIRVELRFTGDEDGQTGLDLPDFWGGESELWRVVHDLQVSGEDAAFAPATAPERREITHAPGAELVVRYQVVPDRSGPPRAATDDYYRPYAEPGYVHLIGHTIFAEPDRDREAGVRVDLVVPNGWALASDLQHDGLDYTALGASVIVAGDFRVETRRVSGADIRIAMRGAIDVDDTTFMNQVETVITGNLAYWEAEGEPYLVTVLPLEADEGWTSIGGTNLDDSFAMFVTTDADLETLTRILAHEHTHTWNIKRLGGALPGDPGDEAAGYWFSEGFTDFLTTRAGVRGGIWPAQTALAHWNVVLAENASSPLRDAPNAVIGEQFWQNRDAQRLPYHRGEIFAALVDHEIRTRTGGEFDLDDVIMAMRDAADEGPAPARFAATVLSVTGVDISGLVTRHIENGEPVELARDTFGPCGTVETVDEPVFDYGMTGDRNEDGQFVISAVDRDGPAWPAGFRPGMVILERLEGAVGDASVDSVLRVRSEAGTQDLRYRPATGETRRLQRIIPAEGDLAANGCAARLAGLPV